jgi:hypothetical protein
LASLIRLVRSVVVLVISLTAHVHRGNLNLVHSRAVNDCACQYIIRGSEQ